MLKILVIADDDYPTIHPSDCPFAIETDKYNSGHEYDCGIPTAKQWHHECECENGQGKCPYLELCKKPLDK